MYLPIIKNSLLYLLCFYTYKVIAPVPPTPRHKITLSLFLSLVLGFVTFYCKSYWPTLSYLLPFFSFIVCVLFIEKTPTILVLFSSMISYSFNLLMYCVLSLIVSLLLTINPISNKKLSLLLMTLTVFVLQIIINSTIARRRKRRISSLATPLAQTSTLVLFVCIILVIYTIQQVIILESTLVFFLYAFLLPALLIVLIVWWRSQITKSYREKLRLLEVESLRTSQQEQANYITQLERENERMGRIIHKDNRIVNAMADSVSEYLRDTSLSAIERNNKGVALAEQIESIHTDRQNILLAEEHIRPNPIAQTGYAGVDAMISYMAKEASQNHISLQFDFRDDFFKDDSLCMTEADLVHLLSDSLKNAIIATKHNNGKNIKLSMLKLKGIPTIAISDSGIPFTIDTYMNFGFEKSSTHTDEGGSGIGLLDIWSLKEKYKATLYIDEHPTTDTFTKQLVFIFDKKNRYMISSNRYKEIQHQQSRADLYVVNPAVERSL